MKEGGGGGGGGGRVRRKKVRGGDGVGLWGLRSGIVGGRGGEGGRCGGGGLACVWVTEVGGEVGFGEERLDMCGLRC